MKRLVVIGGGELKEKTTLKVDTFIANLVKSEDKRTYALFIPTASHDSKPYFNTFRKTYTSELGAKVDVAISTKGEMSMEHIAEKIQKADIIYVGGGDTKYMLDEWKKSGLDKLLIEAYERGVVLCGLSAGAICWFEKAHSDYMMMEGGSSDYAVLDGLGLIKGICVPHFSEKERVDSWEKMKSDYALGLCIENDCGVYFEDGKLIGAVGDNNAYLYENGERREVEKIDA
ncbi:MAG: peptidase E [Clostridia bacterium]|nr:peptidase E [Clostridia bacterium]